jgi:uncharacterized protein with PQ loop repeat
MEVVAWVGSVMLAVCAAPQAFKTYHEKHAESLSIWFLGLCGGGEILLLIYTVFLRDWALVFNYGVNLVLILIIARYKFWPKYDDVLPEELSGGSQTSENAERLGDQTVQVERR